MPRLITANFIIDSEDKGMGDERRTVNRIYATDGTLLLQQDPFYHGTNNGVALPDAFNKIISDADEKHNLRSY